MLHELFYTSAAKTFDGTGYGVVGRTQGFPPVLEKFVRQISHYDFLPASGENVESSNPPAFSHFICSDSGQRWHVLSRIGFGGYDYSNRPVFLAHHVAVADNDALAGNPARLMQEPSLFSNTWSGDAREIAARDFRPRLARPPANGAAWERSTGDRNWSAAWLDKSHSHAGQPCFVVVPADVDVLALFSEALALLPDAEAWKVTFSTYLGQGRAAAQIDWGALIAGTPAAAQFRARYADRVMQLTKNLGKAPLVAASDSRRPTGSFKEAIPPDGVVVEGLKPAMRSTAPAPVPAPEIVPLPPPPPPRSPDLPKRRYAIGAACLVAVVGIGMWGLLTSAKLNEAERELEKRAKELENVKAKLKSEEESRLEERRNLAAARFALENAKSTLRDVEQKLANSTKKSTTADEPQNTPLQLNPPSPPAVAATVVYVEHGLRAALNNKSGLLLTRGFPGTPKLQLTSHPDFGLRVVGLGTEIVVSLATDGSSKLHLRIETQTGEQRLIASWDVETNDSETQDTILDSLCLSYLDIMGEGFAAPEKGTSLRVLFTPRLKPLKFEPASEKSENPKGGQKKAKKTKDDLPAPPDDPAIDDTLAALNMLAKLQPAEGRLRVDGITLAGQDLDLRLTPALEGDFEKLGKGHFANDIFRGKRHGIGFELATDSRGLIFARVEVRDYPKENEGESGERERCRSFADLLRKFGEVHGSVLIKYPNGPELPIICFANQTDP